MAQPEWQNVLKERMMAQQTRDEVHKELISNCESVGDSLIGRLARLTVLRPKAGEDCS